MSKALFRGSRPEVLPQQGTPEKRSKPTGEHPCGSVIPTELLFNSIGITLSHEHSTACPSHSPKTPITKHLRRAACVFSYLKLIIQIIQQILSDPRNFYKFYMDSF